MRYCTFPSLERFFCGGLVLSCLAGCSLQDFDYLKSGGSGGAGGADASGAGGAGTGGTGTDEGGAGGADMADAGADGEMATDASSDGPEVAESGSLDANHHADGGPSVLVNPGFETGLSGWSFEPPTAMGKYAYTQFPQGVGATTIDGQYELATWSGSDAFTVRVFQIPSNLPSGTYTLSGHFNRADGFKAAYLYSRNCGGPDLTQNIPPTAATEWVVTQITGIQVTGGQCEVGFYVDSNPADWLNADGFSFSEDLQ